MSLDKIVRVTRQVWREVEEETEFEDGTVSNETVERTPMLDGDLEIAQEIIRDLAAEIEGLQDEIRNLQEVHGG